MRIGMVVDRYKPYISGITNYISLNKQYLEAAGHDVFVFTFGDEDYQDDEPNVIRSTGLPLLDTGYYLSLSYSKPARKLLYSMDVAHVHHPFLSGSLALRYCRPRGIPLIFTNHTRYDLYAQAYLPILADIIGETAIQAFLPSFCRSCDLVISPSSGMRDILIKLGVDAPIDTVPNGIDLSPFSMPLEKLERGAYGFCQDDILLIYTGRLGPEKNLPFLLRSFAGAAQAYENARLLIVGNGPERENLRAQAEQLKVGNKIHFTGAVPYQDMPRYLAIADAFVTASVTEVHPLSVMEAMASGLPVLGIRSPGVADIVEDGKTGCIIAEADIAAFTAKMMRMMIDRELRLEMGQAARKAVEAYDIQRTTQLMFERYQKVVDLSAARKRSFRARFSRMVDNWSR